MNLLSYGCLAIVLATTLCVIGPAQAFDSTSAYQRRSIGGFTVFVNRELLNHPEETKDALEEFKSQAKAIDRVVPRKPLAALHQIHIWMEWENKKDGAAEFHPSKQWLEENGYNPEKARCIEISNIRNFVKWSRKEQPWMLLHELAHSYHFTMLGEDDRDITQAYQHAMDEKLYDSVDYVNGGKNRAYATTNEKEYFAELSEAYFGKNDFYPFNRAELQEHDPVGYALMVKVWGVPRDGASINPLPFTQRIP